MKPLTEINKDYFKIAVEQAVLDNLLGNGKITLDEKYYHKRSIKLMKEAQEFGKQQQAQEFEKMIESFIERYQREGSSLYKDVGKHWLYTDELQELLKEVQGKKELGEMK